MRADAMRIAIDYDGTYTRAPALWDAFIAFARADGHEVLCVTQRNVDDPEEAIINMPCPVIYTSRQPKGFVMQGMMPDVWIDDQPHLIFNA